MRFLGRAAVAVVALALLAPRAHSQTVPQTGEYDVTGIHDEEGAYTGTAKLVMDGLKATMTVSCTARTGKSFGWSGTGKLVESTIKLTIDPTTPGDAGVLSGAKGQLSGHAEYVVADDRTLSGYWQFVTEKRKDKTPRAGGATGPPCARGNRSPDRRRRAQGAAPSPADR